MAKRIRDMLSGVLVVCLLGAAPLAPAVAAPASLCPVAATGPVTMAPVRLVIPAIGVVARVQPIDVAADLGDLGVTNGARVGWDTASASLGGGGNVVLVGLRENATGGPAVFWRLDRLLPGDAVTLCADTGATFTYSVTLQRVDALDQLTPADIADIQGATTRASLTLITDADADAATGGSEAAAGTPERYIVRAALESQEDPAPPHQPGIIPLPAST